MPLTTSAITSRGALKGEGAIHSEKWHRCWEKVQADGHDSSSAAAICTNSIGYGQSVNEEHQSSGRHASANPKRFRTKEGQRHARARERAAKKTDAESVLKFNKNHEKATGRFASGPGGSGGGGETVGKSKAGSKAKAGAGRKPATRKGAVAPGHPTPDPNILHSPKDALHSLLNGEGVNIAPEDVHEMLMEAADLPLGTDKNPDPDLTDVYVEGHLTFGGDGLGIDRIDMPQIPREHRDQMLKEAKEAGISITYTQQSPLALKPSQDKISARKVGEKLRDYEGGKKKDFPSLLVSNDGYILDGHHHWGIAAALALEHGGIKVPTTRLNAPVKKALAFLNGYVDKYKIPRAGISAKQDPYMAEEARLAESFAPALKYNPHHGPDGKFTSGGSGGGNVKEVDDFKTGKHFHGDAGHYSVATYREQGGKHTVVQHLDNGGTLELGNYRSITDAHSTAKTYAARGHSGGGGGGHVPITRRLYEAGALKLSAKEKKYHGITDATVLQTPARASVQAQAKAVFTGTPTPTRAEHLATSGLTADATPQFKIHEVPLASTSIRDPATVAGIKNYAKALQAQLAPKPRQAAQHAKSHVHGTSSMSAKERSERSYKPGSLTAEFLSRMPLVEFGKKKR
jgi:hypothetical protein